MAPAVNATLSQSLDAVVLDMETTGLDAKKARLLQLGAIRITGAALDSGARRERLLAAKLDAAAGWRMRCSVTRDGAEYRTAQPRCTG